MDLETAFAISAAGMRVEAARLRVVAENLANADSTGATPGADPYRRKQIMFKDVFDRELGADIVQVAAVVGDQTPFPLKYDPAHPAANAAGYVKQPNVTSLIEVADMQDAEHSYSANLAVLQMSRAMLSRTIGMLK